MELHSPLYLWMNFLWDAFKNLSWEAALFLFYRRFSFNYHFPQNLFIISFFIVYKAFVNKDIFFPTYCINYPQIDYEYK